MAATMSPPSSGGGPSNPPQPSPQLTPAAPPSRLEIERKLSFKSAAAPRNIETPRKTKKPQAAPPSAFAAPALSGNDSDSSSVTSSSYHPNPLTSPTYPSSPLLTPVTGSVAGLSAIAERHKGSWTGSGEDYDEDLEEVEEEGDGEEGEESEEVENEGGDLQRGMEGERVLKSGYLFKKQERRKAWKRKWFVLRTGKLAYYKDDREYSLKRVLDLKSIQTVAPVTVKKHSFSFGIVTSKRTFLAKASSQDEMDDWVRAINAARRKMSEREEEERVKRTATSPMAVPNTRSDRLEPIDTHAGTYGSVFSSAGGSISSSPVAVIGYSAPHPPSMPQATYLASPVATSVGLPSSPMDRINTLSLQMARMNMSNSPSSSSAPGMPGSSPHSRVVSSTSRREPSASSISSAQDHYNPVPASTLSVGLPPTMASSDEDEPYFSDPASAFQLGNMTSPSSMQMPAASVDPKKIILSAYLMKRSKGRGRKVWRKRWFTLTSQGLTYTKSHMDSRALRFIPLSVVLDALELSPHSSASDVSDSEDEPSHSRDRGNTLTSGPTRQFSSVRHAAPALRRTPSEKSGAGVDGHLFRLITAKRTFVLCAPTEEDEIKWLAAVRALLHRQRERSGNNEPPHSPMLENAPRMTLSSVPMITQQPPTPAGGPTRKNSADPPPPTPSLSTAQGPPVLERPTEETSQQGSRGEDGSMRASTSAGTLGRRERSATYIAKGAVADVIKRYHPEGTGQ